MIAFLKGKFTVKTPAIALMDVHGVGYEVHISLPTYSYIQDKEEGMLHTWLQVREDAHVLYGFYSLEEKQLFLHLISVSGVGAATARVMLSSQKPEDIVAAITQSNVKWLEQIKGIGKKTAERIIVELKDKLGKHNTTVTNISLPAGNSLEQDALNALIALGIARATAEQAIKKVLKADNGTENLETIIKKSLQAI
ncbi:Holliday junction branch migration protein RuvA [Parasegetibacter sp. NRK P23]|uniref:Holliday junction branch migration protein RuvA n=1 Tax=Parasegetibacter sp. NRK P23 TaxID=2942999 RepID=UPI002044BFB2|nr:Holliday junction branch migration protein RuvA [Parasegetibacter sp. NRK P23]MCM5527161.1 Holliday junction branch migration protein RuvA [Parasegetibacter sp. NRK P23]